MRMVITTTNAATQVYSRRRNAMAPSRIAPAISIMRSLPWLTASTWRV